MNDHQNVLKSPFCSRNSARPTNNLAALPAALNDTKAGIFCLLIYSASDGILPKGIKCMSYFKQYLKPFRKLQFVLFS